MNNLTLKIIVIIISFVMTSHSSIAQFFGGINIGYAFSKYYSGISKIHNTPFNSITYSYDHTTNLSSEDSNKDDCKFNIGNGIVFCVEGGYKINKHLTTSINFSYLNNNNLRPNNEGFKMEIIVKEHNIDSAYNINNELYYYSVDSLSRYTTFFYGKKYIFSPNIAYRFFAGKFSPEIIIGFSLSNFTVFREFIINYNCNSPRSAESIITKAKFKKELLLSPFFSFVFDYKINDKLSLRLISEWRNFLNFFPDNGIQYSYTKHISWPTQAISTVIDNNEYKLPIINTERYNFSSIDISIGIRYFLNSNSQTSIQ